MTSTAFARRGVIILTLALGLVLAVMPLAPLLVLWRPEWPLLIAIYWAIALPHRVSVGTSFVTGLAVDILLGSTLGFHASAYAVVGYLAARYYNRLRNFSFSQQMLLVALLILIARSVVMAWQYLLHDASLNWAYFYPALSSALLWPWLFLLLRKIRRNFGLQ